MNRLRFSLLTALCLSVAAPNVAPSAPVRGQRTGLEQVPAKAPIVLHLRGVQGSYDRFVAMMKNALPDVLKKIQPQMDEWLKDGIMGRKLRGMAKDGPIFLAFVELPTPGQPAGGPPKMAIIVAVSNYKEFRDNLLTEAERGKIAVNGRGVESVALDNESVYFVDRKSYAVVTPSEEVANSFTKKQEGLDGKLSKEQAAKFLAGDFSAYINMEALNKQYAKQFKEAREEIESNIDKMTQQGGEEKKIFEMFKKAIAPVFQTIEDTRGVVLSVSFRPGGLALHLEGEVSADSMTAARLEGSKPIAFEKLGQLPKGQAFYIGMKGGADFYKSLAALMTAVPNAESARAAELMEAMAKAGPNQYLSCQSIPASGLNVYHFDDPAKAVAATLNVYRNIDPKTASLKEKPTIKPDAENYGAFKLHHAQLVWDFDKMAEPMAAKGGAEAKKKFAQSMKNILGEKTNTWFGSDGKIMVQASAADWPAARKLLDQYFKNKNAVGEMKTFRAARKEMPARTSILGLIDAVQLFGTIAEAYTPLLALQGIQLPPGWPKLPAKGTAGFVGLAVTLQPKRGGLDLFLSADSARAFYKAVVKPLLGE